MCDIQGGDCSRGEGQCVVLIAKKIENQRSLREGQADD